MLWTGISDAVIGFTYVLAPLINVLLRGDKKPTPIDGLARNT
jgi:hypothetical protein